MKGFPVKSKIGDHQLLKISTFKEVIKPTVPHKHDNYFELIIMSQGAGYHVIDDVSFEVIPPVIFFLKPGQTHCWDFSKIPKGYVILFKEELLSKEDMEIVFNLNTTIRLSAPEPILDLAANFCGDFNVDNNNIKVLKAYLHLLLLKISVYSGSTSLNDVPFNEVYYKYKSLVNDNFDKLKHMSDYAGLLHVSPSQLNLICKKASGKTASALLNERILLESKSLLANTAFSIKQIALNLKFSDPSHFVKFFKQNTALTPAQYREIALLRSTQQP